MLQWPRAKISLQRFVRSGDATAFSEIVRRHAGLVYGACVRVLGDADRAADATQETFFQFLRDAGRITGSLPNWLHRVAMGKAVDVVRKDSSRKRREAEYADLKQRQVGEWKELSPYLTMEGQTFTAGQTMNLDAQLVKSDGKWLINGL